ncbi:hypothetical protein E4U22_001993 [Claviceps purpurea]|uniref:Uncharacterized protein n=2 Tax=Claviceps TaxID=5110 RepID=M1W5A5_CLAP2|nr:hypothetical protein E4U12_006316 [Claviceps purpurea]KAG6302626.1 hypothetical protein E4U09_002491 [Claviceps aff. purpurea]CCE29795.1 uncharacterized protein CPUR_03642 [Claviceps purpurea 20.1]KAG6134369.1 hypothetical protein E4U38_002437 [Claviceps purpurea]KAG6155615.1 hypothetical protein E4U37_001020 [Claviceps purpurea]
MNYITPQRVILICLEEYSSDFAAVITAFFASQNLPHGHDDYMLNYCIDGGSPYIMYYVLDIHCFAVPEVDPNEVELKVFKVSKPRAQYVFRNLGENAAKRARPLSLQRKWGADWTYAIPRSRRASSAPAAQTRHDH